MKTRALSLISVGAMLAGWLPSCRAVELTPVEEPAVETSEGRIATLQVGSRTLTNVVVFERRPETVYLRHDGGLLSVSVDHLDDATRERLGYASQETIESTGRRLLGMVKTASTPGSEAGPGGGAPGATLPALNPEVFEQLGWRLLAICGGVVLVLHLLFSAILRVICIKAQAPPGLMIWIPGLQMFPLLRAAKMSWAWPWATVLLSVVGVFLVGTSPDLALAISGLSSLTGAVVGIVWCFKICVARGKNPLLGLMLLFPGLNLFGFVYLAASE